jgi:hypothetical protein
VLEGMWRLILQIVDRVDYAATSVRLLFFDWLNGPEPMTEADRVREMRLDLSEDRVLIKLSYQWVWPIGLEQARPHFERVKGGSQ